MSGSSRRCVLAGLVALLLAGALWHADVPTSGGPDGRGGNAAAVVGGWAATRVGTAALRARSWPDGEALTLAGFARAHPTYPAGAGLAGLAVLLAASAAWWASTRPRVRPAALPQFSLLAAGRAPPARG